MFSPDEYELSVPLARSGAKMAFGDHYITVYFASSKEVPTIKAVRCRRSNWDDNIDEEWWGFGKPQRIDAEIAKSKSFSVELHFKGEKFSQALALFDEQTKQQAPAHSAGAARSESLRGPEKEWVPKLAPTKNLLRSLVVGGRLHMDVAIDGVSSPLFLVIKHQLASEHCG